MSDFFAGLFGVTLWLTGFFAWFTALVQSAQHDAWALFVSSFIFPPWGVLVGIGYWLGIV